MLFGPWQTAAIAATGALIVGTIGFHLGAKNERTEWLDARIEAEASAARLRRELRAKAEVMDRVERDADTKLAAMQNAVRRLGDELGRKIEQEPLVVEVDCPDSRRALPDVDVYFRLFNCAASARDCADLPDPVATRGGDGAL